MNTKVNEGKLISGKEALIALANGEMVEMTDSEVDMPWTEICVKNNDFFGKVEPCPWMFINTPNHIQFRLKPRTITINGIEVPAPFKPNPGDVVWFIDINLSKGYSSDVYGSGCREHWIQFGAWRTEEEIKQVVAALRQVFGGSHDN